MDIKIIEELHKSYNLRNKQDEENALREIAQEIALSGLARTDFFKHAAFVGGSCLRIVHGLNRFSEDLDFWTAKTNPNFAWKPYLQAVEEEFRAYAFHMIIEDREITEDRIKRAFLKKESIGKVLTLSHARSFNDNKKLKIKFEIDTNPPKGADFELRDVTIPHKFSLTALDKPSLFASKIAALFDRSKEKGRHWYDFVWYIFQKWPINFRLLTKALSKKIELTPSSLGDELVELVKSIDWKSLKEDVRNFIAPEEQMTLELWSPNFFLGQIEALNEYIQPEKLSLGMLIFQEKGRQLLEKVLKALQQGANVNDDSVNGHRPLQLAITKRYEDVAKLLIENGADLNYRDRSGLTPLQVAVNQGLFQTAKLLIQKGAVFNPTAPNLAFDQVKLYEFLTHS